jgi:hypothetical protein
MLRRAKDILIARGHELYQEPRKFIAFTKINEADLLLNDLDNYPHAFVLACIMDRQIKAEKAWLIPFEMKRRLGNFHFDYLKILTLDAIRWHMTHPRPLHRFQKMVYYFFYSLKKIDKDYGGDARKIWNDSPSSATLIRRFLEFEGVGQKIASMAANILVRDFKISVSDKYSIDVSVDVLVRRVFLRIGFVRKGAKSEEIIYFARSVYPEYPGIIDLPAWQIGREWCRPRNPVCTECYMSGCCLFALNLA